MVDNGSQISDCWNGSSQTRKRREWNNPGGNELELETSVHRVGDVSTKSCLA